MKKDIDYTSPDQLPLTIRVEEAAVILRISRNTAYALVRSGTLPSFKVGRQLRISKRNLLTVNAEPKKSQNAGQEMTQTPE